MNDYIQTEIGKSQRVVELISRDSSIVESVKNIVGACSLAIRSGKKIMFAGNGGSAADAQHWAAELVGRLHLERPGVAAIALTTDTSILTAIGNDYGYDQVFARQVGALGVAGDILVGISTSGNSPSVLRALEEGHRRGLITVGFTGQSGGSMPALCDHLIRVPSDETPRIQEGHVLLGHIVCGLIERVLFGSQVTSQPRGD